MTVGLSVAERHLCKALRNRQLNGHRFRRQFPIENYIADFVCLEQRSIIEVDGGQHNENADDLHRTQVLTKMNFTVLRYWNNDVLNNLEGVIEDISSHLALSPPSRLSPVKGGGAERIAPRTSCAIL